LKLFILADYLSRFYRVVIQLCSDATRKSKVAYAAEGKKSLYVKLGNDIERKINLAYDKKDNKAVMKTKMPGSLLTAGTITFKYKDRNILCIEKLRIETMGGDHGYDVIQDYDPYAWDMTKGKQDWISLTKEKITYYASSCKKDTRTLSQTKPFKQACHTTYTMSLKRK